jgi:excisionase family DNA binding protein
MIKTMTNEKTKREFFSTKEVSKMLNIAPLTLTTYVKQGMIKAYMINGRFFFKKSDIDLFLEYSEVRVENNENQ